MGSEGLVMTIFLVDDNSGRILRAVSEAPDPLPANVITVDDTVHPSPESGKQVWDDVNKQWSLPPPAVIPDALKDIPANVDSVAGLRAAINQQRRFLRGE